MASPEVYRTPVLIVGGGPVGLCLALFLNYWGIDCTILNTGTGPRMHPKGNGQNSRTMEHYRQLGLSDEIRKLGLPNDHPFDQAFFTRFSAYEVFRYPALSWNERREKRKTQPVTDQFPEPMYHVNQMYVEKFLFEKASQAKHVDVKFGWEAKSFAQSLDRVHIRAVSLESKEAEWSAEYCVDCSGGKSFIRRSLGIDFVGDVQTKEQAYFAGKWYTVWLRIPDLYPRFLGARKAWMYWTVNPDPNCRGVLISQNGQDEFELMTKPSDASDTIDVDEVKSWVRRAIGADLDVEIISSYPWSNGAALCVDKYRQGRIMLAGDSAHLFTPVGGFGMNTGIDDAHNLAWKLAAVLQGWAHPGLIDSYETERKPIGFRNTGAARKYSSIWHDPQIPEEIEEDSPEGEAARTAASSINYIAMNHFNTPEELDCTGVQLGARYDGSPVIIADGHPPVESFPETYNRYVPCSLPGGRAPHLWLDEKREMGSSLYDQLGKGFTLLRIGCNTEVTRMEEAAQEHTIPLKVLDIDVEGALELYERHLVLVRPDQYIAWRGDGLPVECDALLCRVCGFRSQFD